jgi:hypothetical protein
MNCPVDDAGQAQGAAAWAAADVRFDGWEAVIPSILSHLSVHHRPGNRFIERDDLLKHIC